MKKALFHIHTFHSVDSATNPKSIVDEAVKLGVSYLIITDHDSLKGSMEAQAYAKQKQLPIEIPLAAEYYTDIGDLIVVGVPMNFQFHHDHRQLAEEAKRVGGFVILPHPYDHHKLDKIDFIHIDCIEVFNSRSLDKNNQLALELADKLHKPHIYGSDAHFLKDLPNALFSYQGTTPFDGQVKSINQIKTTPFRKDLSQMIRAYKIRSPGLAFFVLKRMCKNLCSQKN